MELAGRREELVVLAADLSKYTDVAEFAAAYPRRFLQIGMAEQNLMGVAGGLAKSGLTPIATTYCVFATRRSWTFRFHILLLLPLNSKRRSAPWASTCRSSSVVRP